MSTLRLTQSKGGGKAGGTDGRNVTRDVTHVCKQPEKTVTCTESEACDMRLAPALRARTVPGMRGRTCAHARKAAEWAEDSRRTNPGRSARLRWAEDLHGGDGGVDRRAADLDGDDGVEGADGGLEGLEVAVLVREDTEVARVDAQTDSGVDVLLGRLEPGVTLSLCDSG